ncbi:MAG: homocysteine S-methyltransferase [Anaerocolumna sp.]|nr:homocysteine S-methyltransferase [Anaerocolumna sp.]
MLKKDPNEKKLGTIVLATVSGDIHDIGKNLVVLMLKNYGFNVIDLGKDVSSEKIIEVAQREDADIIGLSALMTTTMIEMKKVIQYKKEAGLRAKVIIGGAVITQSYADEIGADRFAKDAGEAVVIVKELMGLL